MILTWTSRKNSLELVELSSINKVSLVQVFLCSIHELQLAYNVRSLLTIQFHGLDRATAKLGRTAGRGD